MDTVNAALLTAAVRAVRDAFLGRMQEPVARLAASEPWPEAALFEEALKIGSLREAMAVVNDCATRGRGWVDIQERVITPTLYEIGNRWQKNQLTLATEHIASAVAQSVLTLGFQRFSSTSTVISKRVLLACAAGNHHQMGLRMVADAFAFDGWNVEYLGADVLTVDLARHAVYSRPKLVGLSFSFAQQWKAAKEIIVYLTQELGRERPLLLVGGLAIISHQFTQLATLLGADAYCSNAKAAVAYGNQISKTAMRRSEHSHGSETSA